MELGRDGMEGGEFGGSGLQFQQRLQGPGLGLAPGRKVVVDNGLRLIGRRTNRGEVSANLTAFRVPAGLLVLPAGRPRRRTVTGA